ncbi:site-2 protease family protein [Leptolyngbya sp. FACHB-16]|uniref:site-2 protease family protein n=1 Tax=unclassified Leptolyngbya TaxID=2650499 RepID=UPI00168364AB|nr:site-2 protease family protein [Leptolyngbya sp. FACHB-16]MBD2157214.1 site-2 protease family protein [Leptolyngbya sp. FACHB-16]
MKPGWQVGSIFGIPLLIDSSWFIILALFTFSNATRFSAENLSTTTAWVAGLALSLSLFGSVLLHELGHSLAALSQGIKVNSITLFLFGGVAAIDRESKTPGQAFQVAIAGPAVSLGLFILLATLDRLIPLGIPTGTIVRELAQINIVLAIFNMIPGLPLDGGQVLKALVWKVTGSRLKGLRWAANTGKALGWAAIAFGLLLYFQGSFGGLWIGLIGWFVVSNATNYTRVADLQEAVAGLNTSNAMTRDFRVVDADLSLQRFTDDYLLKEEGQYPAFFAASDGRYRGQVYPDDLQQIERSEWRTKILHQIAHPLPEVPSVSEMTPLTEAIDKLERLQLSRITVLTPAGAVAGVIDRGDVVRALAEQLKLPVPDAMIQRIKEEGKFPPGLPLQAIAQSLLEEAS